MARYDNHYIAVGTSDSSAARALLLLRRVFPVRRPRDDFPDCRANQFLLVYNTTYCLNNNYKLYSSINV